MSRRQHTIREGTSEKYWYTLAGYIAVCGITLIAALITGIEAGGEAAGSVLGGGISIVSILGIVVYPALFKDSAYVRGMGYWRPKWWKYIGAGLGIPLLVYLLISTAGLFGAPIFAFIVHAITASGTATVYLYQRHKRIGVP
ncbi:hypothetical protein [Haloparvum sp. AD34]